jgi:nicotinamide-nucleotide adenylyltransferase
MEKTISPAQRFTRTGMVARWQPVHIGHLPVLRALCERSDLALIGIGSANKHNMRSPFTAAEVTDMLNLVLQAYPNYRIIQVPDLDDGPRWRLMLLDMFGELDAYVTENPYVADLLGEDYRILHPVSLVREEDRVPVDGTLVRREMARGDAWQDWVPPQVAQYLLVNHLDARFRAEFGLQTLALDSMIS